FGFIRGRIGDLPSVVEQMAETLGRLRETLANAGVPIHLPTEGSSAEAVSGWLKEHAGGLRHAGTVGVRGLVHALFGAVVGVLAFSRPPPVPENPLPAARDARIRHFGESFRSVAKAQLEISLVNTVLTAIFLFAILPLFGYRLPLSGTLVAIT